MTEEELAEFFKIYKPQEAAGPTEYRAYYDANTSQIICFSEEKLDLPYCTLTQEQYMTFRPDWFEVKQGKIERKAVELANKLRIKHNGTTFATIKDNCQFAVDETYNGEKSYWDPA